jgi:hypothetical protein
MRMQQRDVPPLIVHWLIDYGARRFDHHGAVLRYFDKDARRRLEKEVGRRIARKLEEPQG